MEDIKIKENDNFRKEDDFEKVESDINKFSSENLLQAFIHQQLKDEKYNVSKK